MSEKRDTNLAQGLESVNRKITYHPPDSQILEQFARDVCRELAKDCEGDRLDPEVISGFSNFMKLVARMRAKELNGQTRDLIDKHRQ